MSLSCVLDPLDTPVPLDTDPPSVDPEDAAEKDVPESETAPLLPLPLPPTTKDPTEPSPELSTELPLPPALLLLLPSDPPRQEQS